MELMTRSINEFHEQMNHEFENINIYLNSFGYKVDGEGLKKHCHLNELKSVDYIYPKGDKFPLVEFSDICRQQNMILSNIEKIKSSNIDKNLRRKLISEQHKEINREMVLKYKDTLIIISKLPSIFTDIPDNLYDKIHFFYIVIAPFHPEIEESKRTEIARFLDDLKSKVTQAIPDNIFKGVRVIPIQFFAENI